MKKVIILSLVIALNSATPAYAWGGGILFRVANEVGEFVVTKVDDFLNGTLDVLEGVYKRIWNESSDELDISVETPRIEDLSMGDIAERISKSAGMKIGQIVIKASDEEINCKGSKHFFKVITDTNAVIYIRPTRFSKPVGYYQEGDTLCIKKSIMTDAIWYETNDGWILESDFKDEVVSEKYQFNGMEIYLKNNDQISCEGDDKFVAMAIYKRVVVYSDASKLSDPILFYKRNETVCVTEMRITNYPETWFRTHHGWVKKMDLKRL